MRDAYLRQVLFLVVLAALFFLLISAMLIVDAHGGTPDAVDASLAWTDVPSSGATGTRDVPNGVPTNRRPEIRWNTAPSPASAKWFDGSRRSAGAVFSPGGHWTASASQWGYGFGAEAAQFAGLSLRGARRVLAWSPVGLSRGRGCWCGGAEYWSRRSHRRHHTRRKRNYRREEEGTFLARYNRVEGLFLGAKLSRERWYDLDYSVALWGEGGYGFSSKAWRYQLGLERLFRIERDVFFALGGEIHDLTASQDDWVIPSLENSLAAFLLKEDFRDYYRRQGFSGYLEQNLNSRLVLHAEYREDQMFDMPPEPERRVATNWSLFGGRKQFRPNPLIDEGKVRGAVGRLTLDTRDDQEAPDEGWYVQAQAEFYGGKVASDYSFDRFILDVRRYQPLGYGENLDIRLRAGTSRAPLPSQFLFDLGGISTLRGRRFKAYTGNRMVLANVEYRIRADSRIFSGFPLDVLGGMNLILFVDAGRAWFCENPERFDTGFRSLKWRDLKTDVGVAITDHDGKVRLNIARATDSGSAPLVVTFRINRPF